MKLPIPTTGDLAELAERFEKNRFGAVCVVVLVTVILAAVCAIYLGTHK